MNLSRLFLILPTLIFSCFCYSCNKTKNHIIYDENLEALHGKVKQVKTIEKGFFKNDTIVVDYNAKGYISQETVKGYRPDKWTYEFDKNEKPIKAIENNDKFPHVTGKYDQQGRLVEMNYYSKELSDTSDHFLKRNKYSIKYDTDGYPTFCIISLSDGALKRTLNYKYNVQHALIEQDQYDVIKHVIRKQNYKYITTDEKNNWLKRMIINNNDPTDVDTITRKITYY